MQGLSHVGIRCHDVQRQLAFYTEVLGLRLTDHDADLGLYFLSARPDVEHHEVLLATGRDVPAGGRLIQQISFRCDSLADVVEFYRRFVALGVAIDVTVSHGNAVGLYFYDPEGNRCEVFWPTGIEARQPYVWYVDLDQPAEELLAAVTAHAAAHGATGFKDVAYEQWTRTQGQTPPQ